MTTPLKSTELKEVVDHLDLHKFDAKVHTPKNKKELMNVIKQADDNVRALGSNYSLSDVGVARKGTIIHTDELKMHLSQPWPTAYAKLPPPKTAIRQVRFAQSAARSLGPQNKSRW